MVTVSVKGSFKNAEQFLARMKRREQFTALAKYGPMGVTALAAATPRDSSLTANSWTYVIVQKRGYYSIVWSNTHVEDGVPIAILIQYGHATGNGGYVQGRDFINPAIRPIFDQILAEMWRVVTK